jgi:hypothetical protein
VLFLAGVFVFASLCKSLDKAKKNKAKPEIHDDAEIEVWRMVLRGRRQVRHQQEIDDVPRQHGDQGLKKIHPTWL